MSHEIVPHWRLSKQRLRLIGEICLNCEVVIFPPRDICPNCNQEARTPYELSGKGNVESWALVDRDEAPPRFKKQAPYIVAHIRTEEGPVITARLTDLNWREIKVPDGNGDWFWKKEYDVKKGMPVEAVTRLYFEDGERGPLIYGYKFRPPIRQITQTGSPVHSQGSS